MQDDQLPILVGVGQHTNRSDDLADALEPMEMMALAARRAAEDAGALQILAQLDTVVAINILSWTYPDPAGLLAERLGAQPQQKIYPTIGGNTPQWMVNELADRIARGTAKVALIAGAEAMYSVRRARQRGVQLSWPERTGTPSTFGESKWGNTPLEQAHRAQMPTQIYPLFENALRAKRGQTVAQQRDMLGRLCESFSSEASRNPYAWFRDARTAEEIATPSPVNRMIGFPYPKFMNAIMDVDQAAALLLTNIETARRLGIPREKWVYLWGSGDANDHWYVSDRVNLHSSPAIRAAGTHALDQAGVRIDEVNLFDLYSCFPCAPQIAAAMLGIPEGDSRPLTVTGGLPYAGGPGNNYVTHAVATMAERLRQSPGSIGLVSGVGWYLTKHAVGIYSAAPPRRPQRRVPPSQYQAEIDATPHPRCVAEAHGSGHIESYTVLHDREGAPETGVIVGRLDDGARFWANTPADRPLFERMEREEMIGEKGRVRHDAASATNVFEVE